MKTKTSHSLTEIREGGVHGRSSPRSGWPKPKAHTQCVGQQPKGHWGNSGNTGGDLNGRRQGREREGTNGAARRHTPLEGLINTNTRGASARQLESRLDLHARRTGGDEVGIGGHTAAFGICIWLRGSGFNPLTPFSLQVKS
jgi:hypothetical protein